MQIRSLLFLGVLLTSACVTQPGPGSPNNNEYDPESAAKSRLSLGLTYLKNGNYSQAKFNLDKALQHAPRMADVHYGLAYYYQTVDEEEHAQNAYRKAISLAPDNADIANSYGAFLCQHGDYQQAKTYFLKAINNTQYIGTADSYENLALCSQSQGHLDDAIGYLESALNHQPGRSKTLFLMTQLQVEAKQWSKARLTLKRFEKVGRVTPDSLWLAVQIERGLGNKNVAEQYGTMMLQLYPEHALTKRYLQQRVEDEEREKLGLSAVPTPALKPVLKNVVPESKLPVAVTAENHTVDSAPAVLSEPEDESAMSVASEAATDNTSDQQTDSGQVVDTAEAELSEIVSASEQEAEKTPPAEEKRSKTEDVDAKDTQIAEKAPKVDIPTYHIVKKSDNLYRISIQYNIRMQRLMEWNHLKNASAIYAGQSLLLVDPKTLK